MQKSLSNEKKDNIIKYEPCSLDDPKGITMTCKDFKSHELYHRKISYECLQEIFSKSRPSIEFDEVNKNRWFEMNHPNITFSNRENEETWLNKKNQKSKNNVLFKSVARKLKKTNESASQEKLNKTNDAINNNENQKSESSYKFSPIREAVDAINSKEHFITDHDEKINEVECINDSINDSKNDDIDENKDAKKGKCKNLFSFKDMEEKALAYLTYISDISKDDKFSSWANKFSGLMKNIDKSKFCDHKNDKCHVQEKSK